MAIRRDPGAYRSSARSRAGAGSGAADEQTRREDPARCGPAEPRSGPASGGRAVLRGAHRPDLIRDEVLAEIFRAIPRGPGPTIPALIDGAAWTAGGVHPRLTYAAVAARAGRIAARPRPSRHRPRRRGRPLDGPRARTCSSRRSASPCRAPRGCPSTPRPRPTGSGVCLTDAAAKALLVSPALKQSAPGGGAGPDPCRPGRRDPGRCDRPRRPRRRADAARTPPT